MQLNIQREVLLKPLQHVISVVERRQTLPILAHVMVKVEENRIILTGTDLEVEMIARADVTQPVKGEITLPARKLFDIVRALPEGTPVSMKLNGNRMTLDAGHGRFTLATLPATDFPSLDSHINLEEKITVPEKQLHNLLESTAFAMANQDVRYYLNGLLLHLQEHALRCVATDGHRLAFKETRLEHTVTQKHQIIMPRKGVNELINLLGNSENHVELAFGKNHLRVQQDDVTFTSKRIDASFPDYEAAIPLNTDKNIHVDREMMRKALQRAAILSNEKYRGITLEIMPDNLRIIAQNPEQEEAVEEVPIESDLKEQLKIGFNVNYLLDALAALTGEKIRLSLRDAQTSCLLQEETSQLSRYVIMPIRF